MLRLSRSQNCNFSRTQKIFTFKLPPGFWVSAGLGVFGIGSSMVFQINIFGTLFCTAWRTSGLPSPGTKPGTGNFLNFFSLFFFFFFFVLAGLAKCMYILNILDRKIERKKYFTFFPHKSSLFFPSIPLLWSIRPCFSR